VGGKWGRRENINNKKGHGVCIGPQEADELRTSHKVYEQLGRVEKKGESSRDAFLGAEAGSGGKSQ